MALKSDVKFEEKLICCFKNDKNLVTIFRCFNVFSVLPLQIFQVQTKISTIRPVFVDHLSAFFVFFLSVFSLTTIHESQDCSERRSAFL